MSSHSDLDTRLRQYAARWRVVQEEGPAARGVALLPSSPPAAGRRWLLVALVPALAAACLVAAVLVISGRRPDSAGPGPIPAIVPWSSAGVRADTTPAPLPPKVAAPDDLRPCTSGEFSVVSSTTTATPSGWLTTAVVLRSRATSPCAVPNGYLGVKLVTSDGEGLPLDAIPTGPPHYPRALLVRPGQLISGEAVWAVYQGRAPVPERLVIDIGGRPSATNGLSVSLEGVVIPPHPTNPDPSNRPKWRSTAYGRIDAVVDAGAPGSLVASVTAPSTVTAGEVVLYQVTLTNPTRTPVMLASCPEFLERLSVVPQKEESAAGFRGPLNCRQAPKTIGAGERVTFMFELLTTGVLAGQGQLTWQLIVGGSAVVTAQRQVTVQP